MKTMKRFYLFCLLLAMGTASAVFTSCGDDDPESGTDSGTDPGTDPVTVASISLNSLGLDLAIGGSETLVARVLPDDATVTWSSSDPTVATVDATGKVTAVAVGNVTVTAKAGDKTATCQVVVSLIEI